MNTQDPTPTLVVVNGRPMAKSTDVAACFDKQHKDVLRAISNLEVPEEFNRRNFAPISYIDDRNREQSAFEMTRDGFTILAFGFTGKTAMEWKLAYMAEFNRMEAALRGQAIPASPEEESSETPPIDAMQFVTVIVDHRRIDFGFTSEHRSSCGEVVPVISSQDLARLFDRPHFPLLKQLRTNPALSRFEDQQFWWWSYKDRFKRELPYFYMTRSGFTMLTHQWRLPEFGEDGPDHLAYLKKRVFEAFDQIEQRRLHQELPPAVLAVLAMQSAIEVVS